MRLEDTKQGYQGFEPAGEFAENWEIFARLQVRYCDCGTSCLSVVKISGYEGYGKPFRIKCANCHKQGQRADSVENAVDLWNEGSYAESGL